MSAKRGAATTGDVILVCTLGLSVLHATRDSDNPARLYCTACFTGKYPTPDVTEDVLLEIERDRMAVR